MYTALFHIEKILFMKGRNYEKIFSYSIRWIWYRTYEGR
ncbi:hypothetical protein SAMN05444401_2783 [Clostridium amylolyticum]|uniref:Uncharacterized protein n=1 Tax=Clostridium amylolyticum TaxID=1121298 RepID=A0A1M6IF64_9CLOT|nr:hypothetical protein SAMN05444401_2783 [Clostridium amylolyticum]